VSREVKLVSQRNHHREKVKCGTYFIRPTCYFKLA